MRPRKGFVAFGSGDAVTLGGAILAVLRMGSHCPPALDASPRLLSKMVCSPPPKKESFGLKQVEFKLNLSLVY